MLEKKITRPDRRPGSLSRPRHRPTLVAVRPSVVPEMRPREVDWQTPSGWRPRKRNRWRTSVDVVTVRSVGRWVGRWVGWSPQVAPRNPLEILGFFFSANTLRWRFIAADLFGGFLSSGCCLRHVTSRCNWILSLTLSHLGRYLEMI